MRFVLGQPSRTVVGMGARVSACSLQALRVGQPRFRRIGGSIEVVVEVSIRKRSSREEESKWGFLRGSVGGRRSQTVAACVCGALANRGFCPRRPPASTSASAMIHGKSLNPRVQSLPVATSVCFLPPTRVYIESKSIDIFLSFPRFSVHQYSIIPPRKQLRLEFLPEHVRSRDAGTT